MTASVGHVEENEQRQERGAEGLHPTLRQGHAKDGAPERLWLVEGEQTVANLEALEVDFYL
jgi:hypothetical protein